MQCGFTPRQAYNLFRSVRAEVFPQWKIPPRAIALSARPYSSWPLMRWYPESIADTHYNPKTKDPYGISFNGDYLPFIWEDELRGLFLHEVAHVIAGWEADHGELWQEVAVELGTVPEDTALLREWAKVPKEQLDIDAEYVEAMGLKPTFGYL